jgi:YafQ family addiction module toxin component
MYRISVEQRLERILKKLYRKDRKTYESIMKKVEEILQDPHVYKPLSNEMKGKRRVHISGHFVLVFSIDEKAGAVLLLDFEHHDKIYRKR